MRTSRSWGRDHATAAPYVMALGAVGLLTAVALPGEQSSRRAHLVTVLAPSQGVLYAMVLPDGRPLVAAAHVPVLLAGKLLGWPPGVPSAASCRGRWSTS